MNKKTILIISTIFIIIAIILLLLLTSKKEYTITFDSNGGTKVETQKVLAGEKATKPQNPIKNGYNFIEWQLDNETYDFSKPIKKDITLVAIWGLPEDAETIKITFKNENQTKTIEIKKGQKVEIPEEPIKEGYTFEGWYLNDKIYDFETILEIDTILIAKWKENKKVTITFNANGGSYVAPKEIEYNTKITKPIDPTRNGYTFIGWYLNNEEFNFNSTVKENITLTAKWKQLVDTYTVKLIPYSTQNPEIGVIQLFKNNSTTPIQFIEFQNQSGGYVGKYNAEDKGMRNGNNLVLNNIYKVKLTDGSIINIK